MMPNFLEYNAGVMHHGSRPTCPTQDLVWHSLPTPILDHRYKSIGHYATVRINCLLVSRSKFCKELSGKNIEVKHVQNSLFLINLILKAIKY